jgi:protease I
MQHKPVKDMKVALIIASNGYQQVEYGTPKRILEDAGVKVMTVSDKAGGAVAKDLSTTIVDLTLDEMNIDEYDGIFFIGGPGALEHLDIPISYKLLAEAKDAGIPYGAICIAVRILAKADVLMGKRATGWNEDQVLTALLKGHGAIYEEDKDVVVDGLVVTATGPSAAVAFGEGIVRALTKERLD